MSIQSLVLHRESRQWPHSPKNSFSVSRSLHPSLRPAVIPPVSRNAIVFNFSQLLWLAAQPPAFPHLFPIRPLRSPHKQSLSSWPPASHQVFISKHQDWSPVPGTKELVEHSTLHFNITGPNAFQDKTTADIRPTRTSHHPVTNRAIN